MNTRANDIRQEAVSKTHFLHWEKLVPGSVVGLGPVVMLLTVCNAECRVQGAGCSAMQDAV